MLVMACLAISIACRSPTSPEDVQITVTGNGVTTYTYTANIQQIMSADCTRCHGATQREAGYDFRTYDGVLKAVIAGSDQSKLVRVTQPNGAMYANFSGDRTQKAGIIYDWVVNSHAAQ